VAQARQSTASIDALRAQTKQASAVTTLQDQTARATLANANAQLNKLKTELELTEKDYIRFSELVESGAVSRQTFDACQTKYEAAQAAYQQGQASVAAAQAGLLQTQVNLENEAALQGKVEQAQAGLQQVEVALDETEIRAPFDGIVTTKYVEVGAMVSQGTPLVTVQDPTDNWINLKIREDEISQYALQQKVQLQAHDPAIKIDGVIVDISKKAEFATYRATNERGDTDVVTFNVKIQVDSEQVRPGMRFKLLGGDA
jgi:HlyD family secretion protein